jgi:branched-chain amino acid transport system ATP-binding protein
MSFLEAKNVMKVFSGLVAVNNLSFNVHEGEIVGLIGPNGAGKTTAFNLVSGFLPPDKGTISFNGRSLKGLKPNRICEMGITRTFQITQPFRGLTVFENVLIGSFRRTTSHSIAASSSMKILTRLGLIGKMDEVSENLSIPYLKRIELARALATEPKVLLLDEIMAGLNPKETDDIVAVIREINGEGITILIIEHVMRAIMSLCDRVVVIHHGEKIAEGTPAHISSDEAVIKAYLGEDYLIAGD